MHSSTSPSNTGGSSTAQLALADLPDFGLASVKVKLFTCSSPESVSGMIDALMSNGTWAESDVRRGLIIGISIGAPLGAVMGHVMFRVLGMPVVFGTVFGVFAGVLIGAVISGIVGAGLVNPRLARTVRALRRGQVLVSISSRSPTERDRVLLLLRTGSIALETDRPRR